MSDISKRFEPGDRVGHDFVVDRLLAVTPTRAIYTATEAGQERRTRRCWSCLFPGVPRPDPRCPKCGSDLTDSAFLLAVRTDAARLRDQEAFASVRLAHPGLVSPVQTLLADDTMISAYLWRGERLLVEEPAPLGVLKPEAANRVRRALQFLRSRNVGVRRLGPEHLLWRDGELCLFDLDVCPLTDVPPGTPAPEDELERLLGGLFVDAARWPAAAITHTGRVRDHNEDAWSWAELSDQVLFLAVADGMGGHSLGDVACRVALQASEALLREQLAAGEPVSERVVAAALKHAHSAVTEVGETRRSDMGTTLALAIVQGARAVVGHVGDSRVYLASGGTLRQVTRDHSLVATMVRRGELTAAKARNHRYSNILSQAIGGGLVPPKPETITLELSAGDVLVLCSDGVWGELTDTELAAAMSGARSPREACERVLKAVLDGEAKDNATVVIHVHGTQEG